MKRQLLLMTALAALMTSCARMGAPDGGWYDETPPHVVAATPEDRGTNVTGRKVNIYFNEFIKIDNATEKVVVSPPQMEMPEIKATGRRITVALLDSLKPSTTYTIDFSDAITDNNENNPMGNYTYSFSTGEVIDTLEVAGTVLNAEDLEPVKGILVGLYADSADMARPDTLQPGEIWAPEFIRVSRTDSRGRFVIRGVAPGRYTIGALQDMDGNYRFNSKSEVMAFSDIIIEPSVFVDKRQDTIWADELHIKDIMVTDYNHYLPDNVVLRAFAHLGADRYYLKAERKEADRFTLFFTAPLMPDSALYASLNRDYEASRLPELRGLNFNSEGAFVVEPSLRGDTVTYWLRDTALVNQDTLQIEMTTLLTDTLGRLAMQTDTLEILPKTPYARRLKLQEQAVKEWEKGLERKRKRLKDGEELTDTVMPLQRLVPTYDFKQSLSPDGTIYIRFPYPLKSVNREAVHLYVEQDSLWYRAPFVFQPMRPDGAIVTDSLPRQWELYSEWIPGAQYSLEVDTLAFEDIYGHTSEPYKSGLRVRRLEEFSSLFVNVHLSPKAGAARRREGEQDIIVQLLDGSDKPVREQKVKDGTAEFYYLPGGSYYMRAFVDSNGNGKWDTGDYTLGRQPEEVYYYDNTVECKAKWDITKEWTLDATPLNRQKPAAITKQKAEAAKRIQNRNAKRAQELGIEPPAL